MPISFPFRWLRQQSPQTRRRSRAKSHQPDRARPRLEQLEDRLVPTAVLDDGVLTITGTKRSDVIQVARNGDNLEVTENGVVAPGFSLAAVNHILVRGGKGHDQITIASDVPVPATLSGSQGNDTMTGGGGGDVLLGSKGADVMNGGPGRDTLNGSKGGDSFLIDPGDEVADFRSGDILRANGPVAVKHGPYTDSDLLGTRTDLVSGAPPMPGDGHDGHEHPDIHEGPINYKGYSNPPTYGPFDHTALPTGIYTQEQYDGDLVHNLFHGNVWISYNPRKIRGATLAALQELVKSFGPDAGIVLTPRAATTSAIALTSWAHLHTLSSFDAPMVFNFIVANRGHAPQGFLTV